MNLYQANRQWSTRPVDERFWTLEEAANTCREYAETSSEIEMVLSAESTIQKCKGDNLCLATNSGKLSFTHYSFGQLSKFANAPADYIRTLPTDLAIACLNQGIKSNLKDGKELVALTHKNGSSVLRSLNTTAYARVWNHSIFSALAPLQDHGWVVPPARPAKDDPRARPATKADVLRVKKQQGGIAIREGDMIAPAGVYASDRDMFAFLVNEDNAIDDGSDGGLYRGFFATNSEVGDGSLKLTMFHYRSVCSNHILWDTSAVCEIKVRHVGDAFGKFQLQVEQEMKRVKELGTKDDRARVIAAKNKSLGKTSEEVVDSIVRLGRYGLPSGINQKMIAAAIESTVQHTEDGDPYSVWGVVQGLTRISQGTGYAGQRSFIDQFAGRVLALAM